MGDIAQLSAWRVVFPEQYHALERHCSGLSWAVCRAILGPCPHRCSRPKRLCHPAIGVDIIRHLCVGVVRVAQKGHNSQSLKLRKLSVEAARNAISQYHEIMMTFVIAFSLW